MTLLLVECSIRRWKELPSIASRKKGSMSGLSPLQGLTRVYCWGVIFWACQMHFDPILDIFFTLLYPFETYELPMMKGRLLHSGCWLYELNKKLSFVWKLLTRDAQPCLAYVFPGSWRTSPWEKNWPLSCQVYFTSVVGMTSHCADSLQKAVLKPMRKPHTH